MSKYNIMKAVEYDKLPVKFKKANPFESLVDNGYWIQPKYDGCFGMARIRKERERCDMLSRTGENYNASCGHILDALHAVPEFHDSVVLGEVWHEGDPFPKISGDFRRGQPSPHLLFVMNDCLPLTLETQVAYQLRYQRLKVADEDHAVLRLTASNWKAGDPLALALRYKQMGNYDGVILRNPEAGYTIGTVKNGEIIKVKPVMSLDLKITQWTERVGEKTGRPVYTIGVEYNGVFSEVGSGMPHVLTDDIQVGAIAEIECMGITADGKLREPRFKGIRHDKLKPD